ncbi:MAG TPA: hypothetical protein VFR37_15645 [Longimicrobium sp.]|nr:hypothetical protein [Longimicrobium sp.]
MALFDRNDRSFGYRGGEVDRDRGFVDRAGDSLRRGWDRVEGAFEGRGGYGHDYETRGTMDAGGDYRGLNRGPGNRSREREGLWANSWADGAWTADAADRADRDWRLGRGGGVYDRDIRPAEAGWRAGGMHRGTAGRGFTDRDRNWNLGGGDRDWGHNWGSGTPGGYRGTHRDDDRGFVDRAQNAVRRGWDHVEDAFDRDDDRHLGRGAMRGGTSWAGGYDRDFPRGDSGLRGYRDEQGHYGVMPAHNDDALARPMGAGGRYGGDYRTSGGMHRYAADYDRTDFDRGFKSRQQTDTGDPYGDRQHRTPIHLVDEGRTGRYDEGFRRGRNWF